MLSCILLSAGLSSRFGSPKALAKLPDGLNIIQKIQNQLLKIPDVEIIIVLGHESEKILPFVLKHTNIRVVHNKSYLLGQTSSFKTGLNAASTFSEGFLLLPVDFPAIQTQALLDITAFYRQKKPAILIPTFNGKGGHPPIFSAQLKNNFLKLDDSLGINTLIHAKTNETSLLPVNDPGILKSFNTKEEFNALIA